MVKISLPVPAIIYSYIASGEYLNVLYETNNYNAGKAQVISWDLRWNEDLMK